MRATTKRTTAVSVLIPVFRREYVGQQHLGTQNGIFTPTTSGVTPTRGNKCFPLTFCCLGKRLDICTEFDIFSNGPGKPFFFSFSDKVSNSIEPTDHPCPVGLQLAAVVSFNIYVGIGGRRQRRHPVENRKSTLI